MGELNIFEFIFDTGRYVSKIFKKESLGALRCEKDMYKKYFGPYLGKGFPAQKQNQLAQLEYDEYKRIYEEVARKKSYAELECVVNNELEQMLKRNIFKAELERRNNGK